MAQWFACFALALQLLMPPGMCLCQFVTCAQTESPDATVALDADDCCSHSHSSKPNDEPSGNDDGQQPPSKPAPHQHAPDCPALTDGVTGKTVIVSAADLSSLTLLPAPFDPFAPMASPDSASRRQQDPFAAASTLPPLYLSHCALLI